MFEPKNFADQAAIMRPVVRTLSQITHGPTLAPASVRGRAAQYVRMSTDHQKYSIANQAALIATYALAHDLTIVRSYEDAGRSGLSTEGRGALLRLISDVSSGHADFESVLVYDVSRWGRFQDADEAAYYEYICKRAGVRVYYCAEEFQNDGGMLTTIVKGMKRAMAAEFSRELSVKTLEGQKRIARLGFSHGGTPGYGLRRLLIDQDGHPKAVLSFHDQKHLQTDRVVLVPGPRREVELVREIFEMFVEQHVAVKHIAQRLNERELANAWGNAWTTNNVFKVLRNRSYIGDLIFNRTTQRLMTKRRPNPRSEWIVTEGAYEPILDRLLFDRAQYLLAHAWSYTDADLANYLTAALCVHGRLNSQIIRTRLFGPSVTTYYHRFGTLTKACAIVGYHLSRRKLTVCDPAYRPDKTWRGSTGSTRRDHVKFRFHVPAH